MLCQRLAARRTGSPLRVRGESEKDTGKFWDAGASNVHWVIVKDDQVEHGIAEALDRVKTEGVIVEGNSFLDYVKADITIMCSRAEGGKIKSSARTALDKCDYLYLSSLNGTSTAEARNQFDVFCDSLNLPFDLRRVPIITRDDISRLVNEQVHIKR
jgi:hypothetical protein